MSLNQEISFFQKKLKEFALERDWQQFHTPKNIASALSVESSELLEIFQWLEGNESFSLTDKQRGEVSDEIADVFFYLIRLCDLLNIDIENSLNQKFIKNCEKYPADKVKGSSKKYSEYKL